MSKAKVLLARIKAVEDVLVLAVMFAALAVDSMLHPRNVYGECVAHENCDR